MSQYKIVVSSEEETVVAEYKPLYGDRPARYQSEAELEKEFIDQLVSQGYEYLPLRNEMALIENLRRQLELLNGITFSDEEWNRFFQEKLANQNEGIVEKTRKIQVDYIQLLRRDDGSVKNIYLLDKSNIHNNRLQVINQYEETEGKRSARYDVTILVNGLPLIHIELKRRGISIREAFNQINRYQRNSFWAGSGLYEYIQIFVISNGTNTKYYSNTTRRSHIAEASESQRQKSKKTSNSFEFTSFWADAGNQNILDLVDFTRTFFARHTILNVLTRYCVFTSDELLLVMRPYQIVAAERILLQIKSAHNYQLMGKRDAGGYVWHTTGSGKTLTSFKTAQLAAQLPFIDKVIFVVDRKDLDYQTMKEYDRYEKGAANGNTSTQILQRQMEDRNERGGHHDYKIIVTTIQKLNVFVKSNPRHDVYGKQVVLIFDECHRSQFGEMHRAITRKFRKYAIFGFTGTPIFADNAPVGSHLYYRTTPDAFGRPIHTYTIVDAIRDHNVLPFRVDFINTFKLPDQVEDKDVYSIDREEALLDPRRISNTVTYILERFDQKTKRDTMSYLIRSQMLGKEAGQSSQLAERRVKGFNSIYAVSSIKAAQRYYAEFKKQLEESSRRLNLALIYSFSANEEEPEGLLPDEDFDTGGLDQNSRDFLDGAIQDYNLTFGTSFDTSSQKFENYYKDLSLRVKNREVDLLIVVNMFLTGFDATTLNTLWVDKNLRQHGLIQAFSRTNRILNSIKTYGNIVCFRDLKEQMDEAIALFGDKEAAGTILLRSYRDYYYGYVEEGERKPGYRDLIRELTANYPIGESILGETAQKRFIMLYGAILKVRNILTAFDEFEGNEILTERDFQDYQSIYIDLYESYRKAGEAEKESISDDIIFEMELVRQIEVNIDYILMLVAEYKKTNAKDKTILVTIEKAVNSSLELRSKKKLIEQFIDRINLVTDVVDDWQLFVREKKDAEIAQIIDEERLKSEETKRFIDNAFRDGVLKTKGTDIDRIMPPVSRFGTEDRDARKSAIIERLIVFFEKYFGLV
ncbi:MAG TPA: type I restriction endonuclease subunit R [Bacillota bacterium]|jgi:type I restriction enzyme R subunit|nr:type I restriction endonuclease subunit R [Fastidiosipila sp.]HPX93336.1 type I restriction endonuclease subunit R [Bacillota bacterium]HQB80526.1 type I restriction endonuclease subunit R [Bacillota bacterium]